KVHGEQGQNRPRRNRWQTVAENERPKPPFQGVRPTDFQCFLLSFRKKRRPRNNNPKNQPRKSKSATDDECFLPSIYEKRTRDEGSSDATKRSTAERQRRRPRTQLRRQCFDCRAEATRKCDAFT